MVPRNTKRLSRINNNNKMKPYCNLNGKARWFLYWNDKTSKKIRRIFKKSKRQQLKWQKI